MDTLLLGAQQYQVNTQNNYFHCFIHKTCTKAPRDEICPLLWGSQQTHIGSHPSSLCWTSHNLVWSSTPGVCAGTFPELDLGAVTSAEAAQLPSASHSSQTPITSASCLQEGLLTPSPAVILFVLSSSLLSKTLKEILKNFRDTIVPAGKVKPW